MKILLPLFLLFYLDSDTPLTFRGVLWGVKHTKEELTAHYIEKGYKFFKHTDLKNMAGREMFVHKKPDNNKGIFIGVYYDLDENKEVKRLGFDTYDVDLYEKTKREVKEMGLKSFGDNFFLNSYRSVYFHKTYVNSDSSKILYRILYWE